MASKMFVAGAHDQAGTFSSSTQNSHSTRNTLLQDREEENIGRAIHHWADEARKVLQNEREDPDKTSNSNCSKTPTVLFKRICKDQQNYATVMLQQHEEQGRLRIQIDTMLKQMEKEVMEARAGERSKCQREVFVLTTERNTLRKALDQARVRETFVLREEENLSVAHRRILRDLNGAKSKVEHELPLVECLEGEEEELVLERAVAEECNETVNTDLAQLKREEIEVTHVLKTTEEKLSKQKIKESKGHAMQAFEFADDGTPLLDAKGELVHNTTFYKDEVVKLASKIQRLHVEHKELIAATKTKEEVNAEVALTIETKLNGIAEWESKLEMQVVRYNASINNDKIERENALQRETTANNRRKAVKAEINDLQSLAKEYKDKSRRVEKELTSTKEQESSLRATSQRYEMEVFSLDHKYKHCQKRYNEVELKRRRLEESLAKIAEIHGQEEMLLTESYREAVSKKAMLEELDVATSEEILELRAILQQADEQATGVV